MPTKNGTKEKVVPKKLPRSGKFYSLLVELTKSPYLTIILNPAPIRKGSSKNRPDRLGKVLPILRMDKERGHHVWRLVECQATERYFAFAAMPPEWRHQPDAECTPIWVIRHPDPTRTADLLYEHHRIAPV